MRAWVVKRIWAAFCLLGIFVAGQGAPRAEDPPFPALTGELFGQKPPGMKAEIFAPGERSNFYWVDSRVIGEARRASGGEKVEIADGPSRAADQKLK